MDLPELQAPAGWRTIDVVSDLHLQAGEPDTHRAWQDCLSRPDRPDALFILGHQGYIFVWLDTSDPAAPVCVSQPVDVGAYRAALETLPLGDIFKVTRSDSRRASTPTPMLAHRRVCRSIPLAWRRLAALTIVARSCAGESFTKRTCLPKNCSSTTRLRTGPAIME